MTGAAVVFRSCGRCGRLVNRLDLDACAACGRELCPPCMKLGCCGFVPAKGEGDVDTDAEKESLR